VGGALEEIAQAALLLRGQLVDAGEIGEAGAGLLPERSGIVEEFGGYAGDKRSGGGWTKTMEGAGGEQLAGTLFALDIDETKMGSCGPHAGEEVLHDEAAAGHGSEHPLLGLEGNWLKGLRIEAVGGGQRL